MGIIPILLVMLSTSCKEKGESYLSWRNTTGLIMINLHDAYMNLSAYEDSVLYRGVHYAEIGGNIFQISDTISIVSYGHCWSLDEDNPSLLNTQLFSRMNAGENGVNPSDSAFSYKSDLENLLLDTVYYVRSYVIIKTLSGDIDTGYNQVSTRFRTRIPEDIWFHNSNFDAIARTEASSFVIGNKAYVACGWDGFNLHKDIWEYDIDSDTWTEVAKLGDSRADARMSAVAFVMDDTAYVGTGIINPYTNETTGDMWKWNQKYNFWYQIDSLPANNERANAIAFSLVVDDPMYGKGPRGFIALGERKEGYLKKDLMYYEARADTTGAPMGTSWRSIGTFLGGYRSEAVVSVIGNKAIVGSGIDENGNTHKDFFIYDPETGATGSWIGISAIPDTLDCPPRANGVSFSLSYTRHLTGKTYNYFYFGTGRGTNGEFYNDWYGYDINERIWKRCSDIRDDKDIADKRQGAVAFDLKKSHPELGIKTLERGFVVLGRGRNAETETEEYKNDVWEYLP